MTQPRSPDVREWLGDIRREHGPESPLGHRCSNLLELTERYGKESDQTAKLNILAGIERQTADLKRLLAVCRGHRGCDL